MRERKFLLRAPVIGFPVLTLIFWLMGGGRGDAASHGGKGASGFNMHLPEAQVAKLGRLDKLDYYAAADKDSMATRQRRAMEENYARMLGIATGPDSGRSVVPRADRAVRSVDRNVQAVQEKLAVLNKVLATPLVGGRPLGETRPLVAMRPLGAMRQAPDLERLEKVMVALRTKEAGVGSDPEIAQLNGLLDKLVAVQRPAPNMSHDSVRGPVVHRIVVGVRTLPDEEDTLAGIDTAAIEAIVPEEQVLVSGGEMRLELVGDIEVGGVRIPRGAPVYGVVSLIGERLRIAITAIARLGRVWPVNLVVEDQDGGMGIYIPGAPVSEAVRESEGQAAGELGPTILSTTLAGQAAGVGMNLARSMIGKKVRAVRVTVPEGYRVFLHVQKQGL
jgi:Conjugative transposon, TraM